MPRPARVWTSRDEPDTDQVLRELREAGFSVESGSAPAGPDLEGAPAPEPDAPPLGVAIDLGTTNLRASLWDLQARRRLAARVGPNPQEAFGADVLTRLTAAMESREKAAALARLPREAIEAALRELCALAAVDPAGIGRVCLVGNTAMTALLAGRGAALLLDPSNWELPLECRPEDPASWRAPWGLGVGAQLEVVQPLGGFVGADLLAGVLATRLLDGPAGSLFLDIGTNCELALWDGEVLWATSTAGGPAFEGSGIKCGRPASEGAICRVDRAGPGAGLRTFVIGGGEAKGICGSGLVDLVAALVGASVLNPLGRFTQPPGPDGFAFAEGPPALTLRKQDVDAFQRAKAPVGAATRCLMKLAGVRREDLRRVCVSGAFGRFLDVQSAQAIGLLPPIALQQTELSVSAALAGCERLLFSPSADALLDSVRRRARVVNMSQQAEFGDLFVEDLYLRPMRFGAGGGAS